MWPANRTKFLLSFVLSIAFSACGDKILETENDVRKVETAVLLEPEESKIPFCEDKTSLVELCSQRRIFLNIYEIRDDLYWVHDVGLAFKAEGAGVYYDARFDPKMETERLFTFQTVFQPITGDDNIENVIDVKSWRGGSIFYRDDFNFYCHHIRSDGGGLGYFKEFDPNKLKFLLNDGRLIPWPEAEGHKRHYIDGFHGDYLTDGKKVIDFRCRIKSIEEHKKLVAERAVKN